MKKVFISGISGQDGAWLAKLLIQKGYKVYGGVRDKNKFLRWRLEYLNIIDSIHLMNFDLENAKSVETCIQEIQPDEFYNLAAQSSVAASYNSPVETSLVDGISVLYILEAIKKFSPHTKLFQASSSEIFGNSNETMQNENTPIKPANPYGVAKSYAHWMTVNYRESYGLYSVSGILYSHESELRSEDFFSRKVTVHVANWHHGNKKILEVGNLDIEKDWGYAREFVDGMYLSLQSEKPEDYIFATGTKTKIKNFIEHSYGVINVNLTWQGENENLKAYDEKTGELVLLINPNFYRPTEIKSSYGDPTKAKTKLNWNTNLDYKKICEIMVQCDIDRISHAKTN